jgi:hypothetical protein
MSFHCWDKRHKCCYRRIMKWMNDIRHPLSFFYRSLEPISLTSRLTMRLAKSTTIDAIAHCSNYGEIHRKTKNVPVNKDHQTLNFPLFEYANSIHADRALYIWMPLPPVPSCSLIGSWFHNRCYPLFL